MSKVEEDCNIGTKPQLAIPSDDDGYDDSLSSISDWSSLFDESDDDDDMSSFTTVSELPDFMWDLRCLNLGQMPKNGYLNTTIQKGGVGGHPVIWEHVATLWEVVKDVKTSQNFSLGCNMAGSRQCLWISSSCSYCPENEKGRQKNRGGKRQGHARGDQPPKSRGSGGAL